MLADVKIKEHDLTIIEKEANKKKKQRNKDKQSGEMISPLATNRASQQNRQNNPLVNEDDLLNL